MKTILRRFSSEMSTTDSALTTVIRQKLTDYFQPTHLELDCESRMHNVPTGTEAHFRTLVVSEKFEGLSQLARQRLVNKVLETELADGTIHALRIEAKKPSEYKGEPQASPPACGGGHGH